MSDQSTATQAALWKSIAAPMIPQWGSMIHAPRARGLLDDAAVKRETIDLGVIQWRFPDGSKLRADACRCWVVDREVVR